jgi:hypothetical protein
VSSYVGFGYLVDEVGRSGVAIVGQCTRKVSLRSVWTDQYPESDQCGDSDDAVERTLWSSPGL